MQFSRCRVVSYGETRDIPEFYQGRSIRNLGTILRIVLLVPTILSKLRIVGCRFLLTQKRLNP